MIGLKSIKSGDEKLPNVLILRSRGFDSDALSLLTDGSEFNFMEVHSLAEAVSVLQDGNLSGLTFDALITDCSDSAISRKILYEQLAKLRLKKPVFQLRSIEDTYDSRIQPSTKSERRDICHDVNNLIGASIGYSELALMEIDENGDSREYVELVLNTLRSAVELISSHFSANSGIKVFPFEGAPFFDESMIEIDRFVRKISCAARKMAHTSCELSTRNFTEGIIVAGDEPKLVRVMMNLFFNAIESMGNYGEIIFRVYTTEKTQLYLEVEDSGPGILEENYQNVFLEGFSTKGSNRGHGLAMVREMVMDMGGSIEASKGNLGGALMRISLPVYSGEIPAVYLDKKDEMAKFDDLH
ncbi:MAG: hypothetical protein CVV64_11550 [Candidatus Wallbacteria bacterium HGW-Wallbacteria-1]|uniref:histidine kinase n=1 Tax=Candidatus Wallbacteria bacterium HGW-Wallbacteria-1 TaxID=2013854 RepID=A0A2N1PNR7_9BACT|nr:MAG: hypothetical protein CVV64_11550 [Candidatus Wallbacteria bacterium HGW-Wallbacteria-1]